MVETTRMATHERTDTQNVVRAHEGVLLSHPRKRSTDTCLRVRTRGTHSAS